VYACSATATRTKQVRFAGHNAIYYLSSHCLPLRLCLKQHSRSKQSCTTTNTTACVNAPQLPLLINTQHTIAQTCTTTNTTAACQCTSTATTHQNTAHNSTKVTRRTHPLSFSMRAPCMSRKYRLVAQCMLRGPRNAVPVKGRQNCPPLNVLPRSSVNRSDTGSPPSSSASVSSSTAARYLQVAVAAAVAVAEAAAIDFVRGHVAHEILCVARMLNKCD
jgi:hypothetical protein